MLHDPELTFGDLLREGRLRAGLSQEQLAAMAGVSAAAISSLERGWRRAPYNQTVALLAKALRLSQVERAEFAAVAQAARVRRRVQAPEQAQRLHLPAALTAIVGREDDIAQTIAALGQFRVVTVTGTGGIGKTRLALEIARRVSDAHWDDVCFADLTSLTDGAFIAGRIASMIQPPLAGAVETVSSLVTQLGDRRLLLILDNCEHLIAAVASIAHAITTGCPQVTILATSRERLRIGSESIHRLSPLRLPTKAPDTLEEAAHYAALDLFLQRSRQRDPSMTFMNESVAYLFNICRRLEGIPLAIELAVARLPFLGLKMLDARLDEHFSLPDAPRNLPRRQQTMQATIAWSVDLLDERERDFFARSAIFSGGFTLDAAESVCAFDNIDRAAVLHLVASLADKSLIEVVQTNDHVRYVMLESVRALASQQLDRSQLRPSTARRHAQWLAEIADGIDPPMSSDLFRELTPELENARAAVAWAFRSLSADDHALGGRIVAGLTQVWFLNGHRAEARALSVASLACIDEEKHPDVAANVLHNYIVRVFNEPEAIAAIERAILLFDRIGDPRGIFALHSTLTFIFAARGLIADARRSAERAEQVSSAERLQTSREYATFLYGRATLHEAEALFDEARADVVAAEEIASSHGDGLFIVRKLKLRLIFIESAAGNLRRAVDLAHEMLESEHGLTPAVVQTGNECLVLLHLLLGETSAAEAAARVVLKVMRSDQGLIVEYVAAIASLRGHPRVAARLMGFIDALLERYPNERDTLQQRTWELLCTSLAQQLQPDEIALHRAEGARLNPKAADAEAEAALNLR